MSITRKRKEPSMGTDESENEHQEDCGLSKKTATKIFNVKSSECIPLPRSGTVPVVTMIIRLGEREEVARILLGTRSMVPLLYRSYVLKKQITVAKQPTARPILDYARQEVQGARQFYTAHLVLQCRHQYLRVSCEVDPLAEDYDTIIPSWWLIQHKWNLLASNGRIKFTSSECQQR